MTKKEAIDTYTDRQVSAMASAMCTACRQIAGTYDAYGIKTEDLEMAILPIANGCRDKIREHVKMLCVRFTESAIEE